MYKRASRLSQGAKRRSLLHSSVARRPTLKERILDLLAQRPGLSDREITDALLGAAAGQQPVNQACRQLEKDGRVERRGNPIGNYLSGTAADLETPVAEQPGIMGESAHDPLGEDALKAVLERWLRDQGWEPTVNWGRARGIDIEARRARERWIIEVKGRGISPQAQGNYFLGGLTELIQRMNDDRARYSLAFPDLARYRGLWTRLPALAKRRLGLSILFIDEDGRVAELAV